MSKIKIAEVITRFDWAGAPDILRIICTYLNPELYEITLVTGLTHHPSTKTKEFFKKNSQKIVVISQLKRGIEPISDLIALMRLYFLFSQKKFDIIHTHTAKAGILARIATLLAGRSIIVHTPHGNNFYGYLGPVLTKIIIILEKILAYLTNRFIVFTELEKKELCKFKITVTQKIRVINQGLELERFSQPNLDKIKIKEIFNIRPDENIVGMVGRLEPIKGPEYFVQAAEALARNSLKTKFMLVGEGSLRQRLEKKIKEVGLENRFILTGWREDIPEILSILDVLVLPSLNEAVGMVLIEAQSLGVPVVAANVGGIPEIIIDQQTGLLVPAKDVLSLAKAINYLLVNRQKRLEMGGRAKAWIEGKFKAQDMVKGISGLYQELMQSRK